MRFFFNGSESLTQTPSFGWSLVEGWVNYIEPRKEDSFGDLQWGTALGPQTWSDFWYLKLYGDPSLRFHTISAIQILCFLKNPLLLLVFQVETAGEKCRTPARKAWPFRKLQRSLSSGCCWRHWTIFIATWHRHADVMLSLRYLQISWQVPPIYSIQSLGPGSCLWSLIWRCNVNHLPMSWIALRWFVQVGCEDVGYTVVKTPHVFRFQKAWPYIYICIYIYVLFWFVHPF